MNLLQPFEQQVARHPHRPALITADEHLTFGQLQARAQAAAATFHRAGLEQGDVVLVWRNVDANLYVTLLALFHLGATALFPDPVTGWSGLARCLQQSPPRALATHWRGRLLRWLHGSLRDIPLILPPPQGHTTLPLATVEPDTPALITFTSGSTGQPKGIVRRHGFLLRQQHHLEATLQPQEGDVDLISLPIFVLSNLASGVTSVLPQGDLHHPAAMDAAPLLGQIHRHQVNRLILPPALCQRLVARGAVLPGLRHIFTGGGPVFPNLLRALARLAPNARITAIYGSTEAEPIATIHLDDISQTDFTTMEQGGGLLAGFPSPGITLRLVEQEVWVSGDQVIQGYLDARDDGESKVRENNLIWHRTGDAARLDEQGRLWLLGRHAMGDGTLFPFAVETAAQCHQGVQRAAFLTLAGRAFLAVQVDHGCNLNPLKTALATAFPQVELVPVATIPMDRRHNSKVDYHRLRQQFSLFLKK